MLMASVCYQQGGGKQAQSRGGGVRRVLVHEFEGKFGSDQVKAVNQQCRDSINAKQIADVCIR